MKTSEDLRASAWHCAFAESAVFRSPRQGDSTKDWGTTPGSRIQSKRFAAGSTSAL